MNAGLYVPKKLKVGYQERLDTYSKKLAVAIFINCSERIGVSRYFSKRI